MYFGKSTQASEVGRLAWPRPLPLATRDSVVVKTHSVCRRVVSVCVCVVAEREELGSGSSGDDRDGMTW